MILINYNYCLNYWQLNCLTKSLSPFYLSLSLLTRCYQNNDFWFVETWQLLSTFKNNKSLSRKAKFSDLQLLIWAVFYAFNLCICVMNLFDFSSGLLCCVILVDNIYIFNRAVHAFIAKPSRDVGERMLFIAFEMWNFQYTIVFWHTHTHTERDI